MRWIRSSLTLFLAATFVAALAVSWMALGSAEAQTSGAGGSSPGGASGAGSTPGSGDSSPGTSSSDSTSPDSTSPETTSPEGAIERNSTGTITDESPRDDGRTAADDDSRRPSSGRRSAAARRPGDDQPIDPDRDLTDRNRTDADRPGTDRPGTDRPGTDADDTNTDRNNTDSNYRGSIDDDLDGGRARRSTGDSDDAQFERVERFDSDDPGEAPRLSRDELRGDGRDDDFEMGVAIVVDDDQLRVNRVGDNSVLARAGLRRGDIIRSINGQRIVSRTVWTRWLHRDEPLEIVVLRDGRPRTIYFEADRRFEDDDSDRAALGVLLDMRYPQDAVVQRVYRDSPAERAGIRPGDEITSVNGRDIYSPQHLTRVVRQLEPGSSVEIEYTRRVRRVADIALASRDVLDDRQRDERISRRNRSYDDDERDTDEDSD
jgi:hypothetical protein